MTWRHRLVRWLAVAVLAGVTVAVSIRLWKPRDEGAAQATDVRSRQTEGDRMPAEKAGGHERPVPKPAEQDDRPAVQRLYAAAEALRLYNFDPHIIGYRTETSPYRKDWLYEVVTTRTHVAQFINDRLIAVNSLYDGSDTRRKPEARNEWYQATATWSEDEAVKETLGILQRLGATNALAEVQGGRHDFQAAPMRVNTPHGETMHVIPFPTVRLYDTNGSLRVLAEFRMGPTGVLGVTEWFIR